MANQDARSEGCGADSYCRVNMEHDNSASEFLLFLHINWPVQTTAILFNSVTLYLINLI